MTLADRLKSSLAVAEMQNSPLAAVPVEDLREAAERLDPEGVWMREAMAHEQRLVDKLNADAALFRELYEWVKSPEVKGLEVSGAIHGYKVSEEFADKAGETWRRVAEEAKR